VVKKTESKHENILFTWLELGYNSVILFLLKIGDSFNNIAISTIKNKILRLKKLILKLLIYKDLK